MRAYRPAVLAAAIVGALSACDISQGQPPANAASVALTPAATTSVPASNPLAPVAGQLQACDYDGAVEAFDPAKIRRSPPGDCGEMVNRIMRFTGLPANFDVVEAPVANAAAVIVLDEQQMPRRVIAFNADFMQIVARATGNDSWAPVSIMAHEIGHHLSGHTITPGGSQAPIELEADKFSCFVLYKMGAGLNDAQHAMRALLSDDPEGGSTHPHLDQRLVAVEAGWVEACYLSGRDCDAPEAPANAPGDSRSPPSTESVRPPTGRGAFAEAPVLAERSDGVRLPGPGGTPLKFNQFVYDEYAYLDAATIADTERRLYQLATEAGVEVVTLIVRDLHGLSPEDYAHAMLRQFRVGKLDVGNGAVIVIAPELGTGAIAMGPGLLLESGYQLDNYLSGIERTLANGWDYCRSKQACGAAWTENFVSPALQIGKLAGQWEWQIRYADFAAMRRAYQEDFERTRDGGYDPRQSRTWRKLVRFEAEVVDLRPDPASAQFFVNEVHAKMVGAPVLVRLADGSHLMLYLGERTPALLPAGRLQQGGRYAFVAREAGISSDTPQLDLLSYDRL